MLGPGMSDFQGHVAAQWLGQPLSTARAQTPLSASSQMPEPKEEGSTHLAVPGVYFICPLTGALLRKDQRDSHVREAIALVSGGPWPPFPPDVLGSELPSVSPGEAGQRFPLMCPPAYGVRHVPFHVFKEVMLPCGAVGQARWGRHGEAPEAATLTRLPLACPPPSCPPGRRPLPVAVRDVPAARLFRSLVLVLCKSYCSTPAYLSWALSATKPV